MNSDHDITSDKQSIEPVPCYEEITSRTNVPHTICRYKSSTLRSALRRRRPEDRSWTREDCREPCKKIKRCSDGSENSNTRDRTNSVKMLEITCNDRLGKKVRVKCNGKDTIGDLKKLIAAQTGTRADKIVLKKWYNTFKDHITLEDYEIHDGQNLELYYQ